MLHGHGHGARAAPKEVAEEPPAGDADRLAPGVALALVAMGLGVFLIGNDFTALNVAIPAIEEDFDVDVGTAQWVINAYALVFGMVIVTGGRLADMFGRRSIFFVGAAIFTVFSALGGAAPNIDLLIATRVGMGIGGALMWPAILGMTYAALPAAKAALAGAIILGVAGVSNAAGPMIGGALTDALSWRWIFFLNVPLAVFAVTVTWAKVHQPAPEEERERIDYGGIAALTLGLLLLLLALDQSVDWGWGDPRIIGMLVASVVLVGVFGFIEPRMGRSALIPSDVLRNTVFRSAFLVVLLMSAVFFATMLYMPQFMQKLLDFSALEAGLGMLPMMGFFAVLAFFSGKLANRFGARPLLILGAVLLVAGPFLLSRVEADSPYLALVPGLALLGIGVGLFYPTITTVAVTALDPSRSSLAGGLVYMSQIGGGAIGLGATTTIFTSASESELAEKASDAGTQLTAHQEAVLHGDLTGTDQAAAALEQLRPDVVAEIQRIIADSFASGIETSFLVIAGVALIGLIVTVLFVRGGEQEAPGSDEDAAPGQASGGEGPAPAGGLRPRLSGGGLPPRRAPRR